MDESGDLQEVAALVHGVNSYDLSGTIIESDEPVWVNSGLPCANIPAGTGWCGHIEELLIPVEYWGQHYVGPHAPRRGGEEFWWRLYAGRDGVTIDADPAQPGLPVTLQRGEFFQFTTLEHLVFEGDGAFMPVQYLEGQTGGAGTGDPASYQMVPTEQFLDRYVFVTGYGYDYDYVQVTRPLDADDVFVDDELVSGYERVGGFEVATVQVSEGAHFAKSETPFGIIQIGYFDATAYGYPGGLALDPINPDPAG